MKGVILAAGLGSRLMPLTADKPKCLVRVGGIAILDRMIQRLEAAGIHDLVVVAGHERSTLEQHLASSESSSARSACIVDNPRFQEWGNFYSLLVARDAIGGESFIKLDADVVLDPQILPRLMEAEGPAVLAVDRSGPLGAEEMKARTGPGGRVVELNKRMAPTVAAGESIGVDRVDSELAPLLFRELEALIQTGETGEYYERAYERMMAEEPFRWVDITDCTWCEIDCPEDLRAAESLIGAATGTI